MDNLIRKKINGDYAVTDDISMNLNTKFSLLFKNIFWACTTPILPNPNNAMLIIYIYPLFTLK